MIGVEVWLGGGGTRLDEAFLKTITEAPTTEVSRVKQVIVGPSEVMVAVFKTRKAEIREAVDQRICEK